MPVGEPAPVCSKFGITPGSLRCQWRRGISVSALARLSLHPCLKIHPVTVVSKFHHVVDANATVAVVVVVGLPNGTETVHGRFPVVAEIPTQGLEIRAVLVATENHSLLIGFALVVYLVTLGRQSVFRLVLDLSAAVSKVEVKFSIGPK